jgi:Ca2+-transporting ATPase
VARGFRVLAFAARQAPLSYGPEPSAAERNLTFVGVAGLEDPPRKEVPAAIATLQEAGVRVLMLTGDHPLTARAIAARVGIDARRVVTGRELDAAGEQWSGLVDTASVFARITPEHKLRIVQALEARGQVVAVTGDGVNDAPALRAAAIGVAMGRTGTSVAREAADLVLADDNFATVTVAVSTGRALYANLRKAIRYYLAAKVALVSASLVAVLAQLPVPFEPVQIIIMELFMELGASTTFVGPPRDPHEPFMNASMQAGIFAGGLSLAAAVAVAYFWAWGQGLDLLGAQATAFATWMIGHLVLAAHMRSEHQPLLRTAPLAHRGFWLWVGGAIIVLIAGTNVPLLQERLHLVPLPGTAWVVALAAGLLAPSWWELWKWWRWTSPKPAGRVG